MKLSKAFEKKILGVWIAYGYHFSRFGIEFTIDKYNFAIGLGFIWFSVEF